MLDRYKSVKYSYNTRTKRYTIHTDNVNAIVEAAKAVIGKAPTRLLLIKTTATQFDVYEFFLLELEYVLESIKESRPDLAINIGGVVISDLMGFLNSRTWLSDRTSKGAVDVLDYNLIKREMKYTPLPHQIESFKKYEVIKRMAGIRGFMLELGAGQGKMEKNGTPVKIPGGWRRIEKLKVGDEVIGSNGRPTTVTGVYPQGSLPLVRLKFSDGRSSDVGYEHLWSITKNKERKATVVKTKKILTLLDKGHDVFIPTIDYRTNKDDVIDDMPIHPYLLGVILNAGSIVQCINITVKDSSVIEKIRTLLPDNFKIHKDINTIGLNSNYRLMYIGKGTCPIMKELKKLKLIDRYSVINSIPAIYREASYLTRHELMKGILECSSTVSNVNVVDGGADFITPDVKVAVAIKKLAWSLGDISTVSNIEVPYALEKSLSRYKVRIESNNDYIEGMSKLGSKLQIIDYNELPNSEATCISVSAKNKLYVTKDYIVTHNTYTGLSLGEALNYNHVVIIAPNNTIDDVWVESVTTGLYKAPQQYYILDAKNKEYKREKYLIFSYESIDRVMKDKRLLRLLKRMKPMLIVDEFHNFNNIKSQRTGNLLSFIQKVDFEDVALLTGTPVKMSLNELKPMLYLLDNKFKPVSEMYDDFYRGKYDMFRNRFDVYRKHVAKDTKNLPPIDIREHRVIIPDAERFTLENINRDIKEFKIDRLSEIMDRMDVYEGMYNRLLENVTTTLITSGVSKTQATKSVNEYRQVVKKIRRFNKDKKLYMAQTHIIDAVLLEKEVILPNLSSADKKSFKSIRAIIKYPELKVLGEALGKVLLQARINCYCELAKSLNYRSLLSLTDKKAIVFSSYTSVCGYAVKTVIEEGYTPVKVYGDEIPNLPVNVKRFNDLDDVANPIVATYKSLSTGVPLLAGNILILLDTPVRNYMLDQSISRAWRIGQDRPVTALLIKLDTGDKFNITDRDHFILNLSTQNVEMITGNENPFEIPEQLTIAEYESTIEEEALTDIVDDIGDDVDKALLGAFRHAVDIDDGEEDSLISFITKKIGFKLK